jgi:regulator of CtrA degradation
MGKREDGVDALPSKLLDLLERSESLYRRIARLDDVFFQQAEVASGVQSQFAKLSAAFGQSSGE